MPVCQPSRRTRQAATPRANVGRDAPVIGSDALLPRWPERRRCTGASGGGPPASGAEGHHCHCPLSKMGPGWFVRAVLAFRRAANHVR